MPTLGIPIFVQFEMALWLAPLLMVVWSALRQFEVGLHVGLLAGMGVALYSVGSHLFLLSPLHAIYPVTLLYVMLCVVGLSFRHSLLACLGLTGLLLTVLATGIGWMVTWLAGTLG